MNLGVGLGASLAAYLAMRRSFGLAARLVGYGTDLVINEPLLSGAVMMYKYWCAHVICCIIIEFGCVHNITSAKAR